MNVNGKLHFDRKPNFDITLKINNPFIFGCSEKDFPLYYQNTNVRRGNRNVCNGEETLFHYKVQIVNVYRRYNVSIAFFFVAILS